MAIGLEIILGFTDKTLHRFVEELGVDFQFNDLMTYYDNMDDNLEKLSAWNEKLLIAHKKALEELGFTLVKKKHLLMANTPLGVREFSPFSIESFYSYEDMGDEPEDAVVGISLSSRYRPVLLDWMNENGSISTAVIDEKMLKIVEMVKEHIGNQIPVFKEAELIVKLIHY